MITETDAQQRAVDSVSYRVRGAREARQLGSERFAKQLKNLLWYLQSDGTQKPPFADASDLYAYRPIAERLVTTGRWTPAALQLLPKT